MKSKFLSLQELTELIADGSSIAMGGSLLHRGPFAFARELIRQGRKNLTFIKPSAGYDLDILSATYTIQEAQVGIVTMEGGFGLAQNYRRAVQEGKIKVFEHA
jgi:glutaconate CoA-transferase subunit A